MSCNKDTCKTEFCGKAAKDQPADKGAAPEAKCCEPKAGAPKAEKNCPCG